MDGFRYWEEVQGAARVGILMPDGQSANGIGKVKTLAEFIRRANHANTTILVADDSPQRLEIEVNGARTKVSASVWRSFTGKRFMDGHECLGERFYFLSNDVAPIPGDERQVMTENLVAG